jgi:hypothetical protein
MPILRLGPDSEEYLVDTREIKYSWFREANPAERLSGLGFRVVQLPHHKEFPDNYPLLSVNKDIFILEYNLALAEKAELFEEASKLVAEIKNHGIETPQFRLYK